MEQLLKNLNENRLSDESLSAVTGGYSYPDLLAAAAILGQDYVNVVKKYAKSYSLTEKERTMLEMVKRTVKK